MTDKYPEHEKLKKVSDKSQAIGEFIDWLGQEKDYLIAEWETRREDAMVPVQARITALLAEFFDIDEHKIEVEKRSMLEELRQQNDNV